MYYFLKTKRKINAAKLKTNPRKTWDLTNRSNLGVQWASRIKVFRKSQKALIYMRMKNIFKNKVNSNYWKSGGS